MVFEKPTAKYEFTSIATSRELKCFSSEKKAAYILFLKNLLEKEKPKDIEKMKDEVRTLENNCKLLEEVE